MQNGCIVKTSFIQTKNTNEIHFRRIAEALKTQIFEFDKIWSNINKINACN